MAIFKPTDCSPFNGTFDISKNSADLPIIFECKVHTSNTIVTGYSIEIYDSNNELVFPSENREIGPVESNVTYLSDLKSYVINNFSSSIPNMRNINSGLNGTYLEIPFYVNSMDSTAGSTVSRNQMSSGLVEGQTYTWKITLYQEVKKDGSFPPREEKYYDMTVASGTVIGSTEKRIQTALIDSDDRVVDNLVLVDKFIQPVQIQGLSNYHEDPVKWMQGGPEEFPFVAARSLITGYDSTYGYIYPSTAADNAFVDGQITADAASGFQIYKNGNNPSNLGATDMVEFIYDVHSFKGTMTWKTSAVKPEQSHWEQVYITEGKPSDAYYPFYDSNYGSYPLTGGERIIFNDIQNSKVEFDGSYYGSPYNGIFYPSFSSKEALNNNVIFAGTYTFKQRPSVTSFTGEQDFSFLTTNNRTGAILECNKVKITSTTMWYVEKSNNNFVAYSLNSGWYNNGYQTITVESDQEVSSDFFAWFSQNVNAIPYQVTVIWNRTTDASNWGTLSNKIVYCRRDSKNYEINTNTQVGEINKTPFKFVEEEPVKIFNVAEQVSEKQVAVGIGNNRYVFYKSKNFRSFFYSTGGRSRYYKRL